MKLLLPLAILVVIAASAYANDGCHKVSCPSMVEDAKNWAHANPDDPCSFCCCRTGEPKYKLCPPNAEFDPSQGKCVHSDRCLNKNFKMQPHN
ncbi:hypothetical protein J437_LFUL009225 [Ladona fulva]|uniref:Uncharacterized protein n=1 Tax=Ladona fulva TaxID=123851 RepID=A0A8K0K8G9_LADFU|nr:hypothetical protein J437_LFUL009225 [Ladona fulva]